MPGGLSNPPPLQLVSGVINARQFGAVGNGVADDTAALQAALDFQKAAGGGTVYLPAGTYLIKSSLFIGSKVTLQGAGRGVTTITKPASVASLLTANAAANAHSATLTDATGFVVGGGIHFWDTTNFDGWTATNAVITGVAGNVVTFSRPDDAGGLWGAINTSRAGTATTGFPLIRNEAACLNIGVRDLTLDHNQNANDPGAFSTADFTAATIHLEESYYGLFENLEILNAAGDAYSDQAQRDATGALNYSSVKTTKNMIRGCRIRGATRHGVHLGTIMNGGYVVNNEMTSCAGYGMFYCAYVTHTVVSGNLIQSCGWGLAGIDGRDFGNVIANNVILDPTNFGIEASVFNTPVGGGTGGAGNLSITGNFLRGGRPIVLNVPDCALVGNVIDLDDANQIAIELRVSADRTLLQGNTIRNGGTSSQGVALNAAGIDDVRLIGNVFTDLGSNSVDINGICNRLVAIGNHHSVMNTSRAYNFENFASVDCVIRDEMCTLTTPVGNAGSCVRLVYEGLGDNGAADPASSGGWNGISGKRYNGRLVRWNSGGGEKISIFNDGVGWTALN